MASKEQILGILAGASGPMSRAQIEEKAGESYRRFQTQLDRWVKQELIEDTGDHHYGLTDKGRDDLEKGTGEPGEEVVVQREVRELAQESHTMTDREKFMQLGIEAGMTNRGFLKGATNLVWNRGDPKDLASVWAGLNEANLDKDITKRWFNFWAAHLGSPTPPSILQEVNRKPGTDEKSEAEKKEGVGRRDYILNEDDVPTYVGEKNGSMDYKDAVDLARIRAGSRGKDGRSGGAVSMADDMAKMFSVFKDFAGERSQGKSYLVQQSEEGLKVEEVDPGRPLVVSAGQGAGKQQPTYFVDHEGQTHEVQPGQPIIIKQPAPPAAAAAGSQYLIDRSTGQVQQIQPGQPIIIQTSPPASQLTPIQVTDRDGKPMVLDLGTFIRLEEHREKQRQDEESHQVKLEIAKGFKDLLKHAQSALSHMGEEEE